MRYIYFLSKLLVDNVSNIINYCNSIDVISWAKHSKLQNKIKNLVQTYDNTSTEFFYELDKLTFSSENHAFIIYNRIANKILLDLNILNLDTKSIITVQDDIHKKLIPYCHYIEESTMELFQFRDANLDLPYVLSIKLRAFEYIREVKKKHMLLENQNEIEIIIDPMTDDSDEEIHIVFYTGTEEFQAFLENEKLPLKVKTLIYTTLDS